MGLGQVECNSARGPEKRRKEPSIWAIPSQFCFFHLHLHPRPDARSARIAAMQLFRGGCASLFPRARGTETMVGIHPSPQPFALFRFALNGGGCMGRSGVRLGKPCRLAGLHGPLQREMRPPNDSQGGPGGAREGFRGYVFRCSDFRK
jgi:hypothetical protein